MRTIKQTVPIYSNASEHHILGYRTLQRGWCLCELSAREDLGKPGAQGVTIHTGFQTQTTQDAESAAIENFETEAAPTFKKCEFSKNTDRPLVEKVACSAL